jgi:putative nucleotidyltransferase with HDIG domain
VRPPVPVGKPGAARTACAIDLGVVAWAIDEIGAVTGESYSLLDHSFAVASTAHRLARALGHDDADCARAYFAGLLHDIGKTQTRREVLFKRGPLTVSERDHVRNHPIDGFEILCQLGDPEVRAAVLHHHELFDGTGYPAGFRASRIPVLARLVGVADYFEALREDRSYRPGFPLYEALGRLREAAGAGKLDPAIARTLAFLATPGASPSGVALAARVSVNAS